MTITFSFTKQVSVC